VWKQRNARAHHLKKVELEWNLEKNGLLTSQTSFESALIPPSYLQISRQKERKNVNNVKTNTQRTHENKIIRLGRAYSRSLLFVESLKVKSR
jgi:hypothetical protein